MNFETEERAFGLTDTEEISDASNMSVRKVKRKASSNTESESEDTRPGAGEALPRHSFSEASARAGENIQLDSRHSFEKEKSVSIGGKVSGSNPEKNFDDSAETGTERTRAQQIENLSRKRHENCVNAFEAGSVRNLAQSNSSREHLKAEEKRAFETQRSSSDFVNQDANMEDIENNSLAFKNFHSAQEISKKAQSRKRENEKQADGRSGERRSNAESGSSADEMNVQKQDGQESIFKHSRHIEQEEAYGFSQERDSSVNSESKVYGYEYRKVDYEAERSSRRTFFVNAQDESGNSGADQSGGRKKRVFFDEGASKTSTGVNPGGREKRADYSQLVTKPFEAGKRTFSVEKQAFTKSFDTAKGLSSGEEDADQAIFSRASGMVKTLMIRSATEAAKLPMRVVKGIVNFALTVMGAIATGGFSLLFGVIAVILSIIVFSVCIVVTACGILWICLRQGYISPNDFASLNDFLSIFNWLSSIFQSLGDIFS